MQVHTVHIAYIYTYHLHIYSYIYIYMCVCVRVCGDIIPADTKFEGEGIKVLLLPSGLFRSVNVHALWAYFSLRGSIHVAGRMYADLTTTSLYV